MLYSSIKLNFLFFSLLRNACALTPDHPECFENASNATAKRILYTRTMVRLLRSCAAKNQKLLATKPGVQTYKVAFQDLLYNLNHAVKALSATKTLDILKKESLNLMIEILVPMQSQSEQTSK